MFYNTRRTIKSPTTKMRAGAVWRQMICNQFKAYCNLVSENAKHKRALRAQRRQVELAKVMELLLGAEASMFFEDQNNNSNNNNDKEEMESDDDPEERMRVEHIEKLMEEIRVHAPPDEPKDRL